MVAVKKKAAQDEADVEHLHEVQARVHRLTLEYLERTGKR